MTSFLELLLNLLLMVIEVEAIDVLGLYSMEIIFEDDNGEVLVDDKFDIGGVNIAIFVVLLNSFLVFFVHAGLN